MVPALNAVLAELPTDVALDDAEDGVLEAMAELFGVLDARPAHVGMTKLAKVLARKRPGLIPVYDGAIGHCYSAARAPRYLGTGSTRGPGTRKRGCGRCGTTSSAN